MPARWVIHVVGPVHSRREDRSHLLAACYRNALRVADELGAASIAFPAVSAGIYGWPVDDAADIAVRTVAATPTAVEDVRFVLFNDEALTQFRRALAELRS
jgi:O-acetyl-ADP-ribose deacetylase